MGSCDRSPTIPFMRRSATIEPQREDEDNLCLRSSLALEGISAMIKESELLDIISEEAVVDRDKLLRDSTFDDLSISSIDLMTLLFVLEERYGVTIPASDIPQVKTLGEITDYILSRLNGGRQ